MSLRKFPRFETPKVLVLVVLMSTPSIVRPQEIIGSWKVDYVTRAVTVEAVEEALPEGNRRLVTVKLRNTSGRPVTAISIDIEDARGSSLMWHAVQPAEAFDFKARNDVRAEPYRQVRLNAVVFADKGPDAGNAVLAEALRFRRLGAFLEKSRCLGVLKHIDASNLDLVSTGELLESVDESPKTLDEVLASLPEDPQLRFESHKRIQRAGDEAKNAFISEVRIQRKFFNDDVRRRLLPAFASPERRTMTLRILQDEHQRSVDALRPLCDRDMDTED